MNAPFDTSGFGHVGRFEAVTPAGGSSADGIRQWLRRGYIGLGVLVLGVGGWATLTDISGAVVAPGVVVVENRPRDVQHLDGGIVREILVRDGERVEAGEVLVRLDTTVVDANRDIVGTRLSEMRALTSRLEAERDGLDGIDFDADLLASDVPEVRRAVDGQRRLFEARERASDGQISQLREQITQAREQIQGLRNRISADERQVQLVLDELGGLETLLDRGFVSRTRILNLQREASRLRGQISASQAEIARIRSSISETNVRIAQLERERQTEVLTELRAAEAEASELRERQTTVQDQSDRIEIRSPVDGVVLGTAVNTVGEVIGPGEVLMQIVPAGERLIIETQVDPADIDEVYPGQLTNVRLSAFNARSTPELEGEVLATAPDRLVDPVTGQPYFLVRVTIPPGEMGRLPDTLQLQPGMPAEAFMQTESRSVLSYLLKPANDAMRRAWREE